MLIDPKKQSPMTTLLSWVQKRQAQNPAQRWLDAVEPGPALPRGITAPRYRTNVALSDLRPGECGTIFRLTGSPRVRLRLLEMGLTPGVHVKVLRAAAFGGPMEILVRGYQLSLRREEAAHIWLCEEADGSI